MNVCVEVVMSIDFIDDDVFDPSPGDPLSDRMVSSVREAVQNALDHHYEEGFSYEMEDITYLGIDGVSAKRL